MVLELIPVCYDKRTILDIDIKCYNVGIVYCDICNDEIYDYYECKNCEFTVCTTCNTVVYNKYIIEDMTRFIKKEYEKIKNKYDLAVNDVYYNNKTGNIYIYNKQENTTSIYKHEKEYKSSYIDRLYKCIYKE